MTATDWFSSVNRCLTSIHLTWELPAGIHLSAKEEKMMTVDFKAAAALWLLFVASVVMSLPVNDNSEKEVDDLLSVTYSNGQSTNQDSRIDGTLHADGSAVDEEGRKLGSFSGKKDPEFLETDRAFKYSVPVILGKDGQVFRDENAPIITRAKRSKKEKKDSESDDNKKQKKKKKDDKGKDEEDKDDDEEEEKKKKELEEAQKEEKRKRKKEQKKAEKKKEDDDSDEDDDESGEEKEEKEKKNKKDDDSSGEEKDKKKKKKKGDDDKEKETKEKKKDVKKFVEDPSREYSDLFRR